MEMTTSLHDLAARMRTQASQATSARNQFVAFFLLGLILLLALFAMQLQTFCDPLIVLTPRRTGWHKRKDAQAALFLYLRFRDEFEARARLKLAEYEAKQKVAASRISPAAKKKL